MTPHVHQDATTVFTTHIMGLSEESRAGIKASLECLERREKPVALAFIVVRRWDLGEDSHGNGVWMV